MKGSCCKRRRLLEKAIILLDKSCGVPSMKNPHVDISHVAPSTCHMVSELLNDKTTPQLCNCGSDRGGIDKDKSLIFLDI